MNNNEETNNFLIHKPVHLYPTVVKMFFYIQKNPKLKYFILSTLSISAICHILITLYFLQKGIQNFPFQSNLYYFNEEEDDFYKEYREYCFLPILILLTEFVFLYYIYYFYIYLYRDFWAFFLAFKGYY